MCICMCNLNFHYKLIYYEMLLIYYLNTLVKFCHIYDKTNTRKSLLFIIFQSFQLIIFFSGAHYFAVNIHIYENYQITFWNKTLSHYNFYFYEDGRLLPFKKCTIKLWNECKCYRITFLIHKLTPSRSAHNLIWSKEIHTNLGIQ